jgi:hypothetical protein
MKAGSTRKREYGAKEDKSSTGRVWVAGFHHVTARSRLASVLKLTNHLFLEFSFFFFGPRWTADTESEDAREQLYFEVFPRLLGRVLPPLHILSLFKWTASDVEKSFRWTRLVLLWELQELQYRNLRGMEFDIAVCCCLGYDSMFSDMLVPTLRGNILPPSLV